jgi:hypothetical protein
MTRYHERLGYLNYGINYYGVLKIAIMTHIYCIELTAQPKRLE